MMLFVTGTLTHGVSSMRRGHLQLVADNTSPAASTTTESWQMTPALYPTGIDVDDPFQRVFHEVLAENRRSKLKVLTSSDASND